MNENHEDTLMSLKESHVRLCCDVYMVVLKNKRIFLFRHSIFRKDIEKQKRGWKGGCRNTEGTKIRFE